MARELLRGAELGAGTDPGAAAGEERGRGGRRLPATAVVTATATGTVAATATAAAVATVSGVLTIQTVCQTVRAVCRPTIAVQNRPSLHTLVLVRRTTVLEKSAGRREEDGAGAGTGCRTRSRNSRRSRSGGHRPPATAAATAAATATGPTTATAAANAAVAAVGTLHAICQSVITVPSQLSACTTVLVDGPGIWAVSSGKGVFAAPVRWVVRVVPGVRAEAGRLRASGGVAGKRSHLPRHACA